jgi:hypothetical protein
MRRFAILSLSFALVVCSWHECHAGPISIVVTKYESSDGSFNAAALTDATNTFKAELALWTAALGNPTGKTVVLTIADVDFLSLGAGRGGSTKDASADGNGLPSKVGKIKINTDAEMFYGVGAPPAGKKSAATVMLHELGHAVGFNALGGGTDGYQKWDDRIAATGTKDKFDMFGTQVTLAGTDANGESHIADSYATDLMNSTIGYGPGSVRNISQLDLCMLAAAFGYQTVYDCPEPASVTLLGIGIAGMAGYGWRRRKKIAAQPQV